MHQGYVAVFSAFVVMWVYDDLVNQSGFRLRVAQVSTVVHS